MTKNYDWEQIKADYRTGAMSNRQLARLYGPDESTIRLRAKKGSWTRDLRTQYKEELRTQRIAQDGGLKERTSEDDELDDETVRQAASKVLSIINKHRAATEKAFKGVEGIQDAINQRIQDVQDGDGKFTEADLKFLSMAQKQNSHSLANMIQADRRSYDMDDVSDDSMPDSIRITFRRQEGTGK
jgi:hypothetical protein